MSIDNTTGRTGSMAQMPSLSPGYVPAYQLSGDPWLLMLNLTSSTGVHTSTEITFPYVTKFIEITNHTTGTPLRNGFSENAVNNLAQGQDKVYILSGSSAGATFGPPKFGPFEIRTKQLFLRAEPNDGAKQVTIRTGIFAGLTTISSKNMIVFSASLGFTNVG